jgi:hypothetical protein
MEDGALTGNLALDDALNRLPYAESAPYNSYAKQHEPTCLPDTRVDILRKIYEWVDGLEMSCIFWLSGLAGTGKSTIARTVAQNYSKKEALGASFFFSRGGGDVSHAGKFVTSIAIQLANNVPNLKRHICEAIENRSDIASRSLSDQWHHLVLGPLSKLGDNGHHSSYALVVDALDECEDNDNIRIIIQLLTKVRSLERVQLRMFVTSRPETSIRHGFCQIPDVDHYDFVLHNISPSIVDRDIFLFLKHNLWLISQENGSDAGWLEKEIIESLVRSSSGLFIWASTACLFIRGGLFAEERLRTLVEGSGSGGSATPEGHLNGIYNMVLQNSVRPEYTAQEKTMFHSLLRDTLGSIAVLFSPLSVQSLNRLLLTPKQRVNSMMKDLHAILDIPQDHTRPVRLHHPSFRDFLLNKERCEDPNFWVDGKQAHWTLAVNCIQIMSISLKQDICGVHAPGTLVADIESNQVEQYLPPEVQYACLYWIQHLGKSGAQLCDNSHVHRFLKVHFLHWLEAMSWMQKISEGILGLISLEKIALVSLLE